MNPENFSQLAHIGVHQSKQVKIKISHGNKERCICEEEPISSAISCNRSEGGGEGRFSSCESKIPRAAVASAHFWDQEGHPDLDHTAFNPVQEMFMSAEAESKPSRGSAIARSTTSA
jgi:hypothetical protein